MNMKILKLNSIFINTYTDTPTALFNILVITPRVTNFSR